MNYPHVVEISGFFCQSFLCESNYGESRNCKCADFSLQKVQKLKKVIIQSLCENGKFELSDYPLLISRKFLMFTYLTQKLIFFFIFRDDDYYNPASMASIKAAEEEQMQEGETIEEFEDRVLNKRAGHLNHLLQAKLKENMSLHFSELTRRNLRKQAAQKFYSMLVLQKLTAVSIDQAEPYGPIMVTKGPKFDDATIF